MDLVTQLAVGLLESHPLDAAQALERLPDREGAALLATAPPRVAAELLRRIGPARGAPLIATLDRARAPAILAAMAADLAAALLRRIGDDARQRLLAALVPEAALPIKTLLRFRDGTAGALLDPLVLALPSDLSAREGVRQVRAAPENARYNVYLTDREQHLVGVVNLRELLLAPRRAPLASIMKANPFRLPADADGAAIVAHPGWREVHSLPVVDGAEVYLGAIRYRTLRRLEEELARGARARR